MSWRRPSSARPARDAASKPVLHRAPHRLGDCPGEQGDHRFRRPAPAQRAPASDRRWDAEFAHRAGGIAHNRRWPAAGRTVGTVCRVSDLQHRRDVRCHRRPAGCRAAGDHHQPATRRPVHCPPRHPPGTAARAAWPYPDRGDRRRIARDRDRARHLAMMVATRCRLDQALVERGLVASRERAQAMVRAGLVRVAGVTIGEPDQMVAAEQAIEVAGMTTYVSRGGEKLAAALDAFAIDPGGRTALDVGASTGGCTDVLLQRGAARVIAVDVGYGQLAWNLRQDPRVTVMERVNIRYLDQLPMPADLAVIDVSFISLRLVLPRVRELLSTPGDVVALVKPQFEVGKGAVGKGGGGRDPEQHREVVGGLSRFASEIGYTVAGETPSPIVGAKGNREFLLYLKRHG